MQYTINRGEKGKVEVKVEVPKVDFNKAYEETLDALSRDTKVDGFRPGNVPRDVLEGKIGANKILNETASFLASKNLSEIFKKEEILPLGNPAIAVGSLAKGSDFSFTASVITKPKIKIGDWKKIKVARIKVKVVTDADVEESIKNIFEAWRKSQESHPKAGPSLAEKSKVKSENEEEEKEDSNKKFIYGAHGEKIFIKDEEPKSHPKAGPSLAEGSRVKNDGINDEFAKAIGARDMAHLREIVKRDLEQIVTDQVEAKVEQEIFDEILKLCEVEVPDILVDDEVNRMVVRLNQTLEQQGRKLDDYLREQNTTVDALRAKWREQAHKNVTVTLVMDEIGRAEKVEVTNEEIEQGAKGADDAKLTDEQKQDLRNYLAVSIFQAKTLDLVKKAVAA